MIYVFPANRRSLLKAILCWPLVFVEVLRLHPSNGWRYAMEWANQSVAGR